MAILRYFLLLVNLTGPIIYGIVLASCSLDDCLSLLGRKVRTPQMEVGNAHPPYGNMRVRESATETILVAMQQKVKSV